MPLLSNYPSFTPILNAWFIFCAILIACNNNQGPKELSPKNTQNDIPTAPKPMNPPTFPIVWLETSVTDVNLRAEPGLEGQVLGYMEDIALFAGEATSYSTPVKLGQHVVNKPWYKIYYNREMPDSSFNAPRPAWVYGGCVRPVIFDCSGIQGKTPSVSINIWLEITKIDSVEYTKELQESKHIPLVNSSDTVGVGNSVTLKLNGKDTIVNGKLSDGEGLHRLSEFKEGENWYYISAGYWEWSDGTFFRKSDGKIASSFGGPDTPAFSPDKKRCAFTSYQGYGEMYTGGIEIFDFNTWKFTALQIPVATGHFYWAANQSLNICVEGNNYFNLNLEKIFR